MNDALVVSIGTTHPWNIAGVGLDAHVAAEYGVAHAGVVVAVSAQDAHGLRDLQVVSPKLVRAQLESLPDGIAAYRVGALVASETVHTVASSLSARARGVPVVVDPVVSVSLGGELQADGDLQRALVQQIVPLGVVLTPNIVEAGQMLGIQVKDESSMREAAQRFVDLGASAAIITGGHLEGDPVDVLIARSLEERFDGPRLMGSMRGGGCTFAAALACELALGRNLRTAAANAHAYVREKIAAMTMRGGLQVAF